MTPPISCLAVPTLQEAEAARNTSNVDLDQQRLDKVSGGDSLPDVPLPEGPHPEACPDCVVAKQ